MEIYQHDSAEVFRFVLRGDFSGHSVQQLQWAWETAQSILAGKELILDISGIADADAPGRELLFCMRKAGARLTVSLPPVSTELLQQLGVQVSAPCSGSSWLSGILRRWSVLVRARRPHRETGAITGI